MTLSRAALPARLGISLLLAAGPLRAQAPAPPAPAAPSPAPLPAGPERLSELVAAAEKALTDRKHDIATARVEEASNLLGGWPQETQRDPKVQALLERLRSVELALQGEAKNGPGPEPGLKVEEEVVALTGEELQSQLQKVRAAEAGTVFDFPIDLNDKVLTWVREFTTTRRPFIEKSLGRAGRYLPMVRQVFAEEGIPQDLAYLAVIESGFQNHARSYAAAVGMWQFIRSTGRIYGLKGSAWVEERRDPAKSTRAAARYLRRLYELSGDWYLALVGYNAGPLTTDRAVANVGSRNFWDLARSRWLRNQTKNYVPELCAAILVGKNPERYGLSLQSLPPFVYEIVQVEKMTSLGVLARTAGVPVEDLKELNPELLRGSTPPGTYPLRVPPGFGVPTARALARLTPAQRLDFQAYTLRKGDTPSRVAARFKVTPEDLLAANDFPASQFRPGRRIKVPPRSPMPIAAEDLRAAGSPAPLADRPLEPLPPFPAEAAAGAEAPAKVEKLPPVRNDSIAAPQAAPQPAPRPVEGQVEAGPPAREPVPHLVIAQPGDTLSRLARVWGFSLARLKALNPQHREILHPGDRVQLPWDAPAAAPEGRSPVHVVRRGETLSAIARRHGLDAAQLRAWNGLGDAKLRPGQRLRLSPPR
ncbi:MAG: LysM peptidoglycan-binding domain-containing protein [Acidobacteria bacterium]|nr:LysM peptidoglycan-binding domain-containing protein [Acidobacteriota bacterium]